MYNIDTFSDMKASVEAVSNGKNTVIFDDLEMPSIMHKVSMEKSDELLSTAITARTHPGFKVLGTEYSTVYVSQFQNITINERAYSLPMRDPKVYVNFDQSLKYCRNKGTGWSLCPNSLWAAIALRCRKNDFIPRGNNYYGKDANYPSEVGTPSYYNPDNAAQVWRTLTGSGPESWYDDGTIDGISDLNGNVWEWVAGLRCVGGEIQIIPDADVMDHSVDLSASSSAWKAINMNGELITPGTNGSLKMDWLNSVWTLSTAVTTIVVGNVCNIEQFASGISQVPQIFHELGIMAENSSGYSGDGVWCNNTAGLETVALRGGGFNNGSRAGVFALNLSNARTNSWDNIGFRSAFYGDA